MRSRTRTAVGRVAVQDLQPGSMPGGSAPGVEVRGVRAIVGDGARSRRCAPHARDAVDDRRCLRARPPSGARRSRPPCCRSTAAAPLDRGTEDRTAAAAARPERVGRLAGVALCTVTSSNATPRNSLTSCAVVVSRPCPCDPEPRYTSTVPSGWTRMCAGSVLYGPIMLCGSMYRPMPDAEEASGRELLALLTRGTRRSRPSTRPARASPRVTRRTGGCPAAACTGARRGCSTLRRRSSSGSMPELPGEAVDRLLTEVGLELPRPAVGRARARVRERRLRLERELRDPVRPGEDDRAHGRRAAGLRVRADLVEVVGCDPEDRARRRRPPS